MSTDTLAAPAATTDTFPINGTDYVEFYVGNAKQASHYYRTAFGFELLGYRGPETGVRDRASYLLQQGKIRLVLTSAIRPDHPALRRGLGVSLYWQSRYAEAEIAFAEAIALKPDYIRAHCDLGEMLAEQRRLAEAETAYTRALHLDPDTVTAHAALAGILLTLNRLEEAEHHCREALRVDPTMARAHFTLWEILERQSKYADLEAAALSVLAFKPDHVDAQARLNRARALRVG